MRGGMTAPHRRRYDPARQRPPNNLEAPGMGVGALGRSRDCRMLFPLWFELFPMPHKHNTDRRHHIPKMSFKVRNWPAYEAGLRGRGSLTLWIEDAALECWQTTGPDGQARYSDAAVQTSLMLRTGLWCMDPQLKQDEISAISTSYVYDKNAIYSYLAQRPVK